MVKIFVLGIKDIGSSPIILNLNRIIINLIGVMELVNMIDLKSIALIA
jgi:hypothetical protein